MYWNCSSVKVRLEFAGDFADDLGAQLAAFLGGVGLQPLDGLQKLFGQALAARSFLANTQDFVLAVAQLLRFLLNQPLQLFVGALVGGDEPLNLGFGEVQRADVVEPGDVAEREQ
jgi:hypothetical protein